MNPHVASANSAEVDPDRTSFLDEGEATSLIASGR